MKKKTMKKIWTMVLTAMLLIVNAAVLPSTAATMNVENGTVDFGRGDAQIIITGNDGQSLKDKEFKLYQLFYAENSEGLESINYTFHPDYKTALQTVVGSRIKKDVSLITEYEVIDYIQSLNRKNVEESQTEQITNGSQTEQTAEGNYSEFRYFVEALRNEIVKENIEGDTIQVSSVSAWNSITVEGLEYGYYIVDEVTQTANSHQATSLCMVNTANPNAAISVKSDYPTVIKKVQEDDRQEEIGNDGWNDIGDFEIGQDIPYQYVSTIPNMNGYNTYYWAWHDNMDEALTLKRDTIQIAISGTVGGIVKNYILSEEEFHLIAGSADNTFTVEIEDLKVLVDREFDNRNVDQENIYGQKIQVTYKAFLNENAIEDQDRPGFENDVRVEFSNNPNQGFESQTGFTPWDTVVCFTYRLRGTKINNYGIALEGAVFRLYTDEACENEVCLKKIASGYQVVNQNMAGITDIENNQGIQSDSKGEFYIYGLDSDTYYLKEVKAPVGYRLLLEPIEVKVKATTTNTRQNYVKGEGVHPEETEISIVNQIGKKLPITGSHLMLIFSVAGVVLMLAAVCKGRKKHV